jgi:hypothetical protein
MKKNIIPIFISIFLLLSFIVSAQGANESQSSNPDKKKTDSAPDRLSLSGMLTQSVIFLYEDKTPPNTENLVPGNILGTAFIIGIAVKGVKEQFIPFIVTAKHVIVNQNRVLARYSMKLGGKPAFMQYDLEALRNRNDLWEQPKDEGVDIVVFRSLWSDSAKALMIPVEDIATKEIYLSEYIDNGDRIIIPCLLENYPGITQNYPIFRDGSIALISEEPVEFSWRLGDRVIKTKQMVIFINSTVNEGFSGAPVFLWPGIRSTPKGIQFGGKPWLLGVVHGFQPLHRPLIDKDRDLVFVPKPSKEPAPLIGIPKPPRYVAVYSQENSAIGIIFPSWQIIEILQSDVVKKRINEISEEVKNANIKDEKK